MREKWLSGGILGVERYFYVVQDEQMYVTACERNENDTMRSAQTMYLGKFGDINELEPQGQVVERLLMREG